MRLTKKAVTNGINNPRDINIELVNAYLARRALDYLVGFNISPFCGPSCLVLNPQEESNQLH